MESAADLIFAILLVGAAALSLPIGAALATGRDEPAPVNAAITAFGGGALLSAVDLVLVPEGAANLPGWLACVLLLAGGATFFAVDQALSRTGGAAGQLLAMLLDYLPEAVALGAMIIVDRATAWVLAAMIFLQNVPEAYAAVRALLQNHGMSRQRLLLIFSGLALLGPICAVAGLIWLADAPGILGGIMVFAAGGVLYLIFEDVAPEASDRVDRRPPLGAVAGFALGLAGHLIAG